MAALSNYLENKLIDLLFRTGTYSVPTTLYVALCTSTPTDAQTGSTIPEVSGGNYVRQSIATGPTTWYSTQGNTSTTSSGTSGLTGNVYAILWTSVTWNATVTSVALCDALTDGNLLWYADLADPKDITAGDHVSFDANTLQPSFA